MSPPECSNCGDFCKQLPPDSQRNIIKVLIGKRGGVDNESTPKSANLFRAANGIHGERRYLVFAGWWRKWLDYVNFDYDSRNQITKKSRSGSQRNSAKASKKQ